MSYSAGTAWSGSSSSFVSSQAITVSPTTVGDVLVIFVGLGATVAPTVSSVSGGGVTTWNLLAALNNASTVQDSEVWWGIVTATGSTTLTVNFSTLSRNSILVQEFSGPSSTWTAGTTATSDAGAVTSGTFPSVTPSNGNELYLGCGYRFGSATTFSGATATLTKEGTTNVYTGSLYNVAPGAGAIAPTWSGNATGNDVLQVAGFLYAAAATGNSGFFSFMGG